MIVTFNPLLLSNLEDFQECLNRLEAASGKEHFEFAKFLCELSRQIRLRLGGPNSADDESVEKISSLFQAAINGIRTSEPGLDVEELGLLAAFRSNIETRAIIIAEERERLADDVGHTVS